MASVLVTATSQVPSVRDTEGHIQTEPFLDLCRLVVPVVDKLGTAFALVKSDINGNIQRLADKAATNPQQFRVLTAMVQEEITRGTQNQATSCTKGLLWLKRAMEFMVELLRQTRAAPSDAMSKVVSDVYTATLCKFHGFIVSSAFTLAFKFVPSREYFIENLGVAPGGDINTEIDDFVSAFSPILQDIHKHLVEHNLDDPTKV
mmetsp:Transcript_15824/g.34134  ORF Transcript_15824/g.34134 Transcript_15824/m.34134 type:complete len:204 (+) Transcript_15824:211-822(+)|eukprot:CAMPEP_0202893250 /NCGR_PEP_ID=MMETSP1392-20130828/2858_1 /ASSEMBLY_ACC=CAM_ASM_000868 /TAXON_ID=225041 /ORGANISM="Chlamydomonas chlamydogama, Strain SAG 11-48b" /LENGTH=203 /DNA_ID=CAMNT_0049577513 /DNA_START=183 /DNA_END=794 /DNA_ORIENTATION=-